MSTTQPTEFLWLDTQETVALSELSRACGLSAEELDELIGYGALTPLQGAAAAPLFAADRVPALREACRLRQDFDLDLFAVAMVIGYLDRIARLEREVGALRAQQPLRD
ncbi:MAG: chaperone modulator CbpM [Burkholderiaceae bacterium]|nr:chaperone modulator CbpM [Burkholderiaceae bacterium]